MATQAKRNARRRARQRKAAALKNATGVGPAAKLGRGQMLSNVPTGAIRNGGRARNARSARGILSDVLGSTVGGFAENALLGIAHQLLGPKAMAVPTAMAGRTSSMQVNSTTQHGVEQLATISVPAGTPAGTVLLQGLIAAPEIGIRLRQNAALWARALFQRFILVITSSNPSTVGGNYTVAVDPDPTTIYASGEELPARLMALVHASKANAWADNAVQAGLSHALLFNRLDGETVSDAEVRQYADGQFILATTTEYPDTCEYTVNVIWSVQFEQPNTIPALLPESDVFTLSTSGETYNVSALNVFKFTTSDVWSNARAPPDGTYTLLSGQLSFQINTEAAPLNLRVTSIVVAGATTTLHTTGAVLGLSSGQVTKQEPTIYRLIASDTFVKVGYAKISKRLAKKPNSHEAWMGYGQRRQSERLRKQAYQARYMELLGAELANMSIIEISSELSNMQI